MNRQDVRDAYYEVSGKASDNVRQLSFAALAVVWIFRPNTSDNVVLPLILLWAGSFAVGALFLDFLQYLYATVAWGWLHRLKETAGVSDVDDFKAPRVINWPTNTFFGFKAVSVALAYVLVLIHLIGVIRAV